MKQEISVENYTVYRHVFPNGKSYIGITGNKPEMRWNCGSGYYKNQYMHAAIKKYGWKNVKHQIWFIGLSKKEAERIERKMIALFKSNNRDYGYNITSGGECIGKHSEESKAKMREKLKGRPSCRKGKHLTEETKRKISEAHKGMRYNIGVPFTEERKRHLREHHADYRGEKNPAYGRKWTPEEIAIRQSHRVYKTGGDHPGAKKICQYTKDGQLVRIWGSISEAAKEYTRVCIKNCLRGKQKQHKGYIWKYYEESKDERE